MQGSDTDKNKAIRDASEEPKVLQPVEVEVGLEPEPPSSNSRIAKNALMLYIRMFLTLIVGLYTSRVVLNTLGVEDYGIYGVVGGVVAMLGFLNASMSGATSRFLTFELGRGDKKRLAETFSSALIVHIIIALIVFVLAETVGLWFLTHKLVIPAGRMNAAHWVYQMSILSAMLGITQVPYNATIIAHEKMDIYAYVEILNVTLKLLIVYLLTIGNFDKLILYAILVFAVSVIIIMVYRIYCIRHFPESHFHWIWNPTILKPLISFSGWDLYGNMSLTIRQQGIQFLVNMFFGVVYNAANNIASTVLSVVLSLSHNITIAFRPQIIKLYSVKEYTNCVQLIYKCCRYSTLLLCALCIPFYFNVEWLLEMWLVKPPQLSALFCRIFIFSCFFNILSVGVQIGIHATGDIKIFSFVTGCCHLCTLPIIYLLYVIGIPVYSAFWVSVMITVLILIADLIIAQNRICTFRISDYVMIVFLQIISVSAIIVFILYLMHTLLNTKPLLSFLLDIMLTVLMLYSIGLSKIEKSQLKSKVSLSLKKLYGNYF